MKNFNYLFDLFNSTQKITNNIDFDAIIDPNGNGDYRTIEEAINNGKYRLFLKEGDYFINKAINFCFTIDDKFPLILVGESKEKTKIITNDLVDNEGNLVSYGIINLSTAVKKTNKFSIELFYKEDEQRWIGELRFLENLGVEFQTESIGYFLDFHLKKGDLPYSVLIEDVIQDKIIFDANWLIEYINNKDIKEVIDFISISAKTYYRLEDVQFDNGSVVISENAKKITVENGNFTRSLKEGLFVRVSYHTTFEIEKIIDDNTILLKDILIGTDFSMSDINNKNAWGVNFGLNYIKLKNLSIFHNGNVSFFNYSYDILYIKNFIIEDIYFKSSHADFHWDGIGLNYYVVNSEFYGGSIYPAPYSLIINCSGDGLYYDYMPHVVFIGCRFMREDASPNGWGDDFTKYIGCYFNSIRGEHHRPIAIACVYRNGEVYTNFPSEIEVEKIKFLYGSLTSNQNGLVYQDYEFQPMQISIGQDKYTWVINGNVAVSNNVDGYRKISFSGRLIKLNVIGNINPSTDSITLSININNSQIYMQTITISNYSEALDILVNEDDLITISILDIVGNPSDVTIEIIERS